ncbi:MAG: hypothetical protein Q9182_005716 [Xanthomendoza sp. 2 TL-2023]
MPVMPSEEAASTIGTLISQHTRSLLVKCGAFYNLLCGTELSLVYADSTPMDKYEREAINWAYRDSIWRPSTQSSTLEGHLSYDQEWTGCNVASGAGLAFAATAVRCARSSSRVAKARTGYVSEGYFYQSGMPG